MRTLIFLLTIFTAMACQQQEATQDKNEGAQLTSAATTEEAAEIKLGDYWYQGEAEITRYELQQNRYRDVHPGEVVMIFVTEDFLTDEQVKNDHYQNPNSTNVLKMNMIRRFTTGLYDYSIMSSVFTPAKTSAYPNTLKVTTSTQDWCGQSFMQLNYRDGEYETQIRSYFESEGDENFSVPAAILEDELFNRIRINPAALPTGSIEILPSLTIARLRHKTFEPLEAKASKSAYEGDEFEGENLQVYTVKYAEGNRTLEIVFEAAAPYKIAGWKDSYPGFDGKTRTTMAKRSNTIMSPYWQKNALEDMAQRSDLGVEGL